MLAHLKSAQTDITVLFMRVIGMPAIYLVIYRRHNKVQQTKGLQANWAMDVGRDAETIWCSDFQTLSFYEKSRAMNKTAYFSFSCDFSFHDTFRQLTNDNVPEISDSIFHPIRQAWKSTGASCQLENVVYDYEGVDYAVDNAHGDI